MDDKTKKIKRSRHISPVTEEKRFKEIGNLMGLKDMLDIITTF